MANNVIPGMAGIYVQSTGEHVSANICGPSRHGDNYIHLKYMRNGKEIEHNSAFDKVLLPIRSPSPSPFEGSPARLLPHVSRACTALSKHGVGVERPFRPAFWNRGAQGGGGYPSSRLNKLFWGPKYRQISLKKHLFFAYFFKSHLPMVCLIAMDCLRNACSDKS